MTLPPVSQDEAAHPALAGAPRAWLGAFFRYLAGSAEGRAARVAAEKQQLFQDAKRARILTRCRTAVVYIVLRFPPIDDDANGDHRCRPWLPTSRGKRRS